MMYLALSYDHRIVDGREAVQFLVKIKEYIEDPGDAARKLTVADARVAPGRDQVALRRFTLRVRSLEKMIMCVRWLSCSSNVYGLGCDPR